MSLWSSLLSVISRAGKVYPGKHVLQPQTVEPMMLYVPGVNFCQSRQSCCPFLSTSLEANYVPSEFICQRESCCFFGVHLSKSVSLWSSSLSKLWPLGVHLPQSCPYIEFICQSQWLVYHFGVRLSNSIVGIPLEFVYVKVNGWYVSLGSFCQSQ